MINWNYEDVIIDGVKHRNHKYDKNFGIEEEFKKILLVEGATTTGETPKFALEFFKQKFPGREFRFAVLVRAENSTGPVKYFAYQVPVIKKLPWHVESWPTFLVHQME